MALPASQRLMNLNRPEPFRELPRIHTGIVDLASGFQNIAGANLAGRIAGGITVGSCEAEDLPGCLRGALGNVACAALLNGFGS
jgi:hypothetical protein